MGLSERNRRLIDEMSRDFRTKKMEGYVQHGNISTYAHCRRVAECSCRMSEILKLRVSEKELVRGAFLHDYFLYDWHTYQGRPLHGFAHPDTALRNAQQDFNLTEKEENIIESHMWPLLPTRLPQSKEAVLVCIADKLCSLKETVLERKRKK